MKTLGLIAAFILLPVVARADDAALAQRGQKVFLYCAACHSVRPNEAGKVGPNLSGAFGVKAASREGYAYSQALKDSGLVWTPENLEKWLTKPGALVPGTKMAFIGLAKPEDRAALIAYLRQLEPYIGQGETPAGSRGYPPRQRRPRLTGQ